MVRASTVRPRGSSVSVAGHHSTASSRPPQAAHAHAQALLGVGAGLRGSRLNTVSAAQRRRRLLGGRRFRPTAPTHWSSCDCILGLCDDPDKFMAGPAAAGASEVEGTLLGRQQRPIDAAVAPPRTPRSSAPLCWPLLLRIHTLTPHAHPSMSVSSGEIPRPLCFHPLVKLRLCPRTVGYPSPPSLEYPHPLRTSLASVTCQVGENELQFAVPTAVVVDRSCCRMPEFPTEGPAGLSFSGSTPFLRSSSRKRRQQWRNPSPSWLPPTGQAATRCSPAPAKLRPLWT